MKILVSSSNDFAYMLFAYIAKLDANYWIHNESTLIYWIA